MTTEENYVHFFFELGMLKHLHRQGWTLLGITDSETVAEHSLRAAQIGFVLASLEKYEHPEHVVTMLVFHDIGECRTGDIHKVANRYVQTNEQRVVADQVCRLGPIGDKVMELWDEMDQCFSPAGKIAKDADLLEMVLTAIELHKRRGVDTHDWIGNAGNRLQTDSAKHLYEVIKTCDPDGWWENLKKL